VRSLLFSWPIGLQGRPVTRRPTVPPDETVEQFLSQENPYSTPLNCSEIEVRLSRLLSAKHRLSALGAVRPFVELPPFTYWSDPLVGTAKGILDKDPDRSARAINKWGKELGHAYDMLMLESHTAGYDHELSAMHVRDIQILGTIFLPEYLRLSEHVLKNLLCIFWSIERKGGVDAKFDLRGGTALLESKGVAMLYDGFVDGVRNGIAHGQVAYEGPDVYFGPAAGGIRMSVHDVFNLYDRLLRSCTGLMLAILLFGVEEEADEKARSRLRFPYSVAVQMSAAAALNEDLCKVVGAYESTMALTGRQLHIGIKPRVISNTTLIYIAGRLTYALLPWIGERYTRILFEIDYGTGASGLLITRPMKLRQLIAEGAKTLRVNETYEQTPMLWAGECKRADKSRFLRSIFGRIVRGAVDDYREKMRQAGIGTALYDYRIRSRKNVSAGHRCRVEIIAVLTAPWLAEDQTALRRIVLGIVRQASRRWTMTRMGGLMRHWGWPTRTRQIFVKLHQYDGSVRWLGSGGWQGGNLVAVAERIRPGLYPLKPVFVKNPQETWRGIRLRYNADQEELARAQQGITELVQRIHAERSSAGSEDRPSQ